MHSTKISDRLRWLAGISLMACSLPAAGQTYVKANGVLALAAVPSVALERRIGEATTFQIDATASLWRSVDGGPMMFLIVIPEWRYHFSGGIEGWYVGAHVGGAAFKLTKWDYLNSDLYQDGFAALLGVSVGFKRNIADRWMLDTFLGGGNSQSIYKGYDRSTGQRYDGASGYNKSGEWLPYRGGVMISYRLRSPSARR